MEESIRPIERAKRRHRSPCDLNDRQTFSSLPGFTFDLAVSEISLGPNLSWQTDWLILPICLDETSCRKCSNSRIPDPEQAICLRFPRTNTQYSEFSS